MNKILSSFSSLYLYLAISLIFCLSPNFSNADPFGTQLGSFNGVINYSNGTTDYVSGASNTYNGTNTGMTWQCPEYCNRYYVAVYQINIRNQSSNNANDYFPTASLRGLTSFANGSTTIPAIGDMLCFTGGLYGHVAIIRAVGSNYVDIIQQNWFNNSSDISKRLTMTVSSGHYTITNLSTSFPCQGWLRKASTTGFGKVSSGVNVSPNPVIATQQFNVNFTLKETAGSPITFETIVCAILDNNNNLVFDLESRSNVTLSANGTYIYNVNSLQFGSGTTPGTYKAVARGRVLNGSWFDFQTTGSGVNPKIFTVTLFSSVIPDIGNIPGKYNLYQNFPNPFNPETKIKFDIPKEGPVTLKVFDITGKELSEVINENLIPGTYNITFDGSELYSGIYFYKIESKDFTETKRMILIK
ncbi:MAG: CHAP domain-containing protein [Ignavibacteria bacterium]|nr:CHAP domain-containing protein [Ignavibacteria bacterium]